MKTLAAALLASLTLTNSPSATADDAPEVLATQVFERGAGEYAAFPNLYRDVQDRIVLVYTARGLASHVNASGTRHAFTTSDCGRSWQPIGDVMPPAVQYTGSPGQYRQIASGGWQKARREDIPTHAIVREVGADHFYAQGLYLVRTSDSGRSWQRERIAAPVHGALMNHHIGSQIVTHAGTYLAALYIKAHERATDQVLVARQSGAEAPTSTLIPGLGGDRPSGGNETALTQTSNGRIIAFIRPDPDKSNRLLVTTSNDDGRTWSPAEPTELTGYPPHATVSGGDIILTTAERRTLPLSIRVYRLDASTLAVKTAHTLAWEISLRPSDFGYPITLTCATGFVTAYYRPHSDGGAEAVAIAWQ